jgi:hypothetical protein
MTTPSEPHRRDAEGAFFYRAPCAGRPAGISTAEVFEGLAVKHTLAVNIDNLGNMITLLGAIGYFVTEVTGFVTSVRRCNIDRGPTS